MSPTAPHPDRRRNHLRLDSGVQDGSVVVPNRGLPVGVLRHPSFRVGEVSSWTARTIR